MTLISIQAAAYRAGLPALDLVHAMNAPPVGPLHARGSTRRRLSSDQVADLVRRFADRRVPVDVWMRRQARAHDVSPATVRRAVYGFASYAAEGGAR